MGVNYKDSFVRIDFMGEAAVRWTKFDRHIRFLQALAQANMIARLSSESGEGWIAGKQLHNLPGLKSDKFDRSAQLRAMEVLDLIKVADINSVPRGFYSYQRIQIGTLGLEVLQLVKDGAEFVLITESGTAKPLDMDFRW